MEIDTSELHDPQDNLDWIIDQPETFIGKVRFEYNDQHAYVDCPCGSEVEIFDHQTVTCKDCQRVYGLESVITVQWVPPGEER